MEFPHGSGIAEHQQYTHPHQHHLEHEHEHPHHHHHNSFPHRRPEDDFRAGFEGDRYPPVAPPMYEPSPHAPLMPYPSHSSHTPAPYEHTWQGSHGAHASSGHFFSHPHEPRPFEASPYEQQRPHLPELPRGQLVRIFCKKNQAYNLTVEHNTVIMKPADTQDEAQQWIKDSSYGMRVKDNYGFPAFCLVNKKTRMILKHAKEKGQQVLLMEYQSDIKDDDILWSESQDFGEGFRTVRCASDTLLNLTVFEGVKTIRNGSPLVLDTWHKGDHQLWKIFNL